MKQAGAVSEKHDEGAETDDGPENSCGKRPCRDDTRYAVQRRRLGELNQLLVLLVTMMVTMMMQTVVVVPASPWRQRLDDIQHISRTTSSSRHRGAV